MRVLLAVPYYCPRTGGLENYARHIASGLSAAGHHVAVVCGDPTVQAPTRSALDGCTVHRLPIAGVVSNTPLHAAWPWYLRRVMEDERADVVNVHAPVVFMMDMVCLVAGCTPVVITYHAGSLDKPAPTALRVLIAAYCVVQRLSFRRADRIIAVSDHVRECLPARLRDKVRVVPNAINLDGNAISFDSEVDDAGTRRIADGGLVFIANLDRSHAWKGLDAVLDALAVLRRSGSAVPRLTVIGDGDDLPRYRARVAELALGDRVALVGRRVGADRDALLAEASALVVYPTSGNDAFPTVVLEAWALGVGVVAAAIGPLPTLVRHGETGVLVRPRDPAALADALAAVVAEPEDLRLMGRRGRQTVLDRFTWPPQIERTIAVYQEVV